MGISLTVWSPISSSGKTVFTFLLACRLSQLLSKKTNILVCCACMKDSDILGMAGAAKNYPSLEELVNSGIPDINKNIRVKGLLYSFGNLYFTDSSKATPLFIQKNKAGYLELMRYLKQEFDLVITDTSSDSGNLLTQMVVENSDHVLNIAVQDLQILERNRGFKRNYLAHIINRYAGIYPDKKELASLFGMKNIFTLPGCTRLQEMKNKQQLFQYAELDTEYIRAIDKPVEFLIKTLNLPREKRKEGESFINLLMKGGRQ